MSSARPSRPYRTARERVATRRTSRLLMRSRQRSSCGTVILSTLLVVLVAGILLTIIIRRATNTLQAIEEHDPRRASAGEVSADGPSTENLPNTLRDPFNVLLIGVDQRDDPDDGIRSDTLIVVHINPREQWAGMLSIPRDSIVQIPQLGQQKINTAYAYGYRNAEELYGQGTTPAAAGGALAAETVEDFLNIQMDYIAQVDFYGFEQIVDTLGGLLIDVPQPLLDPEYPTENFGYERIYIPAGLQVLDGANALRYARSRHSDSDFDRSARQQAVLHALLNNVQRRGLLDQAALLPELASNLEQSVSTTLPISDPAVLGDLVSLAQALDSDRIMQLSINPNDVGVISEIGSDIYWNEPDVANQVAQLLAGPEGDVEVARIQVQNGAGVQGLATRVTQNLTNQGFLMLEATDAPILYEHTTIIDYTDRPQTRQRLADLLGIKSQYVQPSPTADAPPTPYNTDILVVLGQDYEERWAGGQ